MAMKTIIQFTVLSLCVFGYIASAQADESCAIEENPKKKAACIKAEFEKRLGNKDNIKFTRELLRKGDDLYNKKNYYKASRAYDLSRMYLPTSYAYLRESESLFFAYASSKKFEDENAKSTGSCLQPARFVEVVDDTLQTGYKVGVELAKIHSYGPTVTPAYLAEIDKRISCLEAMATQYRDAKTGCVDIAKLKACMGVKK
jgi:hypothetical protein